jgi:hypothetical protein
MSKFKSGDISFSISSKIIQNIMEPCVGGFEVIKNQFDTYECQKVFKTKNEAIDAMIEKLRTLKNE